MKHLDTFGVPVFHETMMTVKLHLICLTIVMPLVHISSIVNILCILVPGIFYEDRGCVWWFLHFTNIFNKFIFKLFVPIVPEVHLIIDNYAKALRMSSFFNEWLYSMNKLVITVRSYTNENLPVIGYWMRLWRFINYLIKVNCDGIVIPPARGHHLV